MWHIVYCIVLYYVLYARYNILCYTSHTIYIVSCAFRFCKHMHILANFNNLNENKCMPRGIWAQRGTEVGRVAILCAHKQQRADMPTEMQRKGHMHTLANFNIVSEKKCMHKRLWVQRGTEIGRVAFLHAYNNKYSRQRHTHCKARSQPLQASAPPIANNATPTRRLFRKQSRPLQCIVPLVAKAIPHPLQASAPHIAKQ